MPFALNFYRDQIAADGKTASPLAPAHRLLYLRHGCAIIDGRTMRAGEPAYVEAPLAIQSAGAWSEVWRWDLAPLNAAPQLLAGDGVFSSLRLARVITTFAMPQGSRWVLRLDQVTTPAGRIADRHQHPGPGIRCLLEGTFNVQQDAESARDLLPGDAWWETGTDTVIAWGSPQMGTRFVRGMVLPPEWEGKRTGHWLAGEAATASARGNWQLLLDRALTV